MRALLHFRNKPSGLVAKDRLKLLLVAERMDCSPQMMTMLQNDLVLAAGKYFKMPLKTDLHKSYPGF